jgi:hypothetical protein
MIRSGGLRKKTTHPDCTDNIFGAFMAKLIGLAFTSPGVAVITVDREKYRVFYHDRSTASDFRIFLQQKDGRKPVVFLKSVRDLPELQKMGEGEVESFVLFEDPSVLCQIEGTKLPDVTGDATIGWTKRIVTPEEFNSLLSNDEKETFTVTEKALAVNGELTKGITFKELIQAVTASYKELQTDSKDFVIAACKYITKQINKKAWVSSARKPALAVGVNVKVLAELEKAIETDKASEELWRAFYGFVVNSEDRAKIITSYAINQDDFEFIVANLNAVPGQQLEFTAVPGTTKKKRAKAS